VLVAPGRVCALDWETAALGPAVLDVAAVTMGWYGDAREALLTAYEEEAGAAIDRAALDAAVLQLATGWLARSDQWTPPPEHARDWLAEVQAAGARLGVM